MLSFCFPAKNEFDYFNSNNIWDFLLQVLHCMYELESFKNTM